MFENINTFAKNIPLVRLVENNDWVVFVLLGSIFVYVLMLMYLHRDASLKEFLLQEFYDAGNSLPSWIIVSLIFVLQISTLLSQYIPVVPRLVNNFSVLGFSLNKFGFAFCSVSVFYLLKTVFSWFFYSSVSDEKTWKRMYFVGTKFYFVVSIILMGLNFVNYFGNVDKEIFLLGVLVGLVFLLIFKLLFYLFNKNKILPSEWYYKILYICTLQIAPIFAIWRLLFF